MKPGPRPKADRPVRWEMKLPTSIAVQVDLMLTNPLTGKVRYGARSALVTQLLREWLSQQRKESLDNSPTL